MQNDDNDNNNKDYADIVQDLNVTGLDTRTLQFVVDRIESVLTTRAMSYLYGGKNRDDVVVAASLNEIYMYLKAVIDNGGNTPSAKEYIESQGINYDDFIERAVGQDKEIFDSYMKDQTVN